jgi:hypothetical protein
VALTTMSASNSAPDCSRIPDSVKVSTWSVTTVANGREQIPVGNQAHPLVPRVVRRREMGVDGVALWQLLDRGLAQHRLHHLGAAAAEVEHRDRL